jgi:hypothetical protein
VLTIFNYLTCHNIYIYPFEIFLAGKFNNELVIIGIKNIETVKTDIPISAV